MKNFFELFELVLTQCYVVVLKLLSVCSYSSKTKAQKRACLFPQKLALKLSAFKMFFKVRNEDAWI